MSEFVSSCLEALFGLTMSLGFPSYAIAIFTIAVVVRVVLLPLNLNQMRSTVAMQQIQPQLKEIQERYSANPEMLNQKTMQLYQDYGVNPLSGCLPTLIQFPIMIGLYQGLRAFVPAYPEYYKFLWISDLSQIDTTYIMVGLVFVSTFLQSFVITGKPTQPMQLYMLIAMPLMMGWMAAKFPAYLCIYWLSITVISIVLQLLVNKPMRAKMEQRSAELAEEKRQRAEQRKSGGKTARRRKDEAERGERHTRNKAADEKAAEETSDNNSDNASVNASDNNSDEKTERTHKKRRRRR